MVLFIQVRYNSLASGGGWPAPTQVQKRFRDALHGGVCTTTAEIVYFIQACIWGPLFKVGSLHIHYQESF